MSLTQQTRWFVIGDALSLLGEVLLALSALLALAAPYPDKETQFKSWLGRAWELIRNTPLRNLPRAVIIRVITAHDALAQIVERALVSKIGVIFLFLGSGTIFGVGLRWAGWFWSFGYFSFRNPFLIVFCLYVFGVVAERINVVLRRATDAVFYVGTFLLFSGLYYRMIEKALTLPNPNHALIALAALSPAAMYLPGFALPAI